MVSFLFYSLINAFFQPLLHQKAYFCRKFQRVGPSNYVPAYLKGVNFKELDEMFIKNDTITLRCAEPEDACQIFIWENDRDIWRVSGTHVPYTRFQIEQFLLGNNDLFSNKQLRLMIDLTESGQSIGCIDIFDYDGINQRAGLGILIDKAYRQQGYAKAALSLCVEYLFHDVMLRQVYCSIDETNLECQQLFVGQGFELCGRRKDWLKTTEGYLDVIEYQLINKPEDLQNMQACEFTQNHNTNNINFNFCQRTKNT